MKTNHFISAVTFALLAAMSCATAKQEVKATSTVEEGPVEPAPPGTPAAPAVPAAPVAASVPQPLPDADFKKFEPPGEGFSVKIPTSAKAEHPKDDKGREVPIVWSVNGRVGTSDFVFMRQAITPKGKAKMGSTEEMFNHNRTMLSEAVGGTVKSKNQFKYKGADAEDFAIAGTMKQVMARSVQADNAVYNMIIFFDQAPPAYAQGYFDSLDFQSAPPAAPEVGATPPTTPPTGSVPPGPNPPPPNRVLKK